MHHNSSSMPLDPGELTQEMISTIELDASQPAFPPHAVISRSTIFRFKKKGCNKALHLPYSR